MKPSIGVLITYYNEKELLTECLDSVFSQTLTPDEVIVYDDFSQFSAEHYIPKKYNLKVIHGTENRGTAYGRNRLLEESKSEYVHFHDADDMFYPLWCEKVQSAIQATKADIVFTEISSFRGDKLVCEHVLGLKHLEIIGDLVRFALKTSILITASTFRKDLALKIGSLRTREVLPQSDDFDFHARMALAGATHTEILTPLVTQHLRYDSDSSKNIRLCHLSKVRAVSLLSKETPVKYKNDLAEAAARAGSALYALSAYDDAAEAFQLAHKLGPPRFLDHHLLYRFVARTFGAETAEKAGRIYRAVLPELLRAKLGKCK